jgi:hypothetical protein
MAWVTIVATVNSNNGLGSHCCGSVLQWLQIIRVSWFIGKTRQNDRQTDMDGPMCSSLTLEREEHLQITDGTPKFYLGGCIQMEVKHIDG